MNISTRIFLIFLIILGLLVALVISMNKMADSQKRSADTANQLHKHYTLASELHQSSDNLTRMARNYVMTGDAIYEQYFYEILAIRDGKIPRPVHYDDSYWDFITAEEKRAIPHGPAISLMELMRQAGISEQELAILQTAKERSDELVKIEKMAFGAIKGLYVDKDGNFTIMGDPDPEFARKILHSFEYHEAKAQIIHPIRTFYNHLNERIGIEIALNQKEGDMYSNITTLLVTLTILFAISAFLYIRKSVVKPILSLSEVSRNILSGELSERADDKGKDEIGRLNSAFNKMIEARIQIEFELKNSEHSLRTTLNSIGDALIATDVYGCVTRMNPVAEKLTGWLLNEAVGKPLPEIFNIINAMTRKETVNPVNNVLKSGKTVGLANHTILIARNGTEYQIADSAAPIIDDNSDISGVVLVFRDVTKDYAIRQALNISEKRYRSLFENSEVAIWNWDMSEIYLELEKLRADGVTDLDQYLKDNKQEIARIIDTGEIFQVNNATVKLFKAASGEDFINRIGETFNSADAAKNFTNGLCAIWDKKKFFRSVINSRTLDKKFIEIIMSYPIPETLDDFKSIPMSFIDITELRKTESALIESEERFKILFENAEVSIWNEDLSEVLKSLNKLREDGVTDIRQYLKDNQQAAWDMADMVSVIQVNKVTLKLFGANTSDKLIKNIHKTFGENAINVFISELCAIWDRKKIFRSEADFKSLSGETINAIISFQIPQRDEDFKSIPVSIIDITELKKTETALRESEERLSLHLENTPLAVIAWDTEMRCIQWNTAAKKIYGYTEEEALGKTIKELLLTRGISAEMHNIFNSLIHQEGGRHTINESVTRDGKTIICEWFNTPLIDKDGNSIGIASMGQDITKMKLVEEELRVLSRAVDQSPASILITDTSGNIQYVNPKFEKTCGYTAKEVMGKNPRFLKADNTSEEQYEALWNTIKSGRKWRGQFTTKRKDGSLFWEMASISPITAEDGIITNFLAVKEDITERKQLEERLRRSQKMEAVGELAGGIAHDFNNLLGVIIGNLDLMKRQIKEGGKLQKQVEKAQNAALRGSALTNRLLNFSHQSPEIGSPANVNKIIRSLEDLVGKSLTRKITLEAVLADDLWMVELNTGDFEDMLINLSLNARDAMPKGGRLIIGTRNIGINHKITNFDEKLEPGEYVEITISDTGSGMSRETTAKIFDPFFTTKEKDKGTGLGLAMVYGFIQRTKGHIFVYSEEEVGTTFKIYLPRSLSMAERTALPAKTAEKLAGGNETILIVDDEEELTLIAKNILEELGYTTICAYNADEALHILESNSIDLLFSDIAMTGSLNGFDLATAVSKAYPGVKILLTSGFAGGMQNTEGIERWENKLMAKPYRSRELANRIRKTLDEKD